jgi:hypothetical protein
MATSEVMEITAFVIAGALLLSGLPLYWLLVHAVRTDQRFSLRALLVATTLVAAALGMIMFAAK